MQDRRLSPLLIVTVVLSAVGMALVGFFWLGGPSAPAPAPVVAAPRQTQPKPAQSSSTAPPAAPKAEMAKADATPAPLAAPVPTSSEQLAREQADMKIGTLLAQNPTVEGARDKLLLLFPTFTPFEKVAAAPHINNLTGDDKLRTVVDFLKNPNTPPEAQETFFNDMLNRPPQVGWPVLIEVIATPNHPLSQRAKELLTTICGQDCGNDVFQWQTILRKQLQLQGALPEDAPTETTNATPTLQQ